MLDKIKFYVRKNKALSSILKPIYRVSSKFISLPKQMAEHNKMIEDLSAIRSGVERIWYFGVPTHSNLGDQAQRCCIVQWLRENYPTHDVFYITSLAWNYRSKDSLAAIKNLVADNDIFVVQSGYTFDGIHPDETSHRMISENFPHNRILIFPQTILYKNDAVKEIMCKAINAHKKTLLLARDKVSYELAQKYYPSIVVKLFPDIVTSQIGKTCYDVERDGVMFCMRNDGERFYTDEQIHLMIDGVAKRYPVIKTDTTVSINVKMDESDLWTKILDTVAEYAKYKVIVTDRYHGTIFSLMAGTPVVILKTTDHKVTTGAEWFKGIYDDYVFRVDDARDVVAKIEEVLSIPRNNRLSSYFDENYYKNLKEIFDSTVLK